MTAHIRQGMNRDTTDSTYVESTVAAGPRFCSLNRPEEGGTTGGSAVRRVAELPYQRRASEVQCQTATCHILPNEHQKQCGDDNNLKPAHPLWPILDSICQPHTALKCRAIRPPIINDVVSVTELNSKSFPVCTQARYISHHTHTITRWLLHVMHHHTHITTRALCKHHHTYTITRPIVPSGHYTYHQYTITHTLRHILLY